MPQESSPLDEFASEGKRRERFAITPGTRKAGISVGAILLTIAASWAIWQVWSTRPAAAAPIRQIDGTAVFTSVPAGATISVDGTSRGVTPLRLSLSPGQHSFDITSGGVTRRLPITVEANAVVAQHVELVAEPPAVPASVPEPRPAEPDPAARAVTAAAAGGFLRIDSPLDVEVLENGTLIGSTRTARMMLPVGSHRLEFNSPVAEYSTTRTVQISAGQTSTVALAVPDGTLSINAVPWAEISIDGRDVGMTPLANLSVPVGAREIVWRHPQLGDRRQTVVVKAQTPTRIGMDLRP